MLQARHFTWYSAAGVFALFASVLVGCRSHEILPEKVEVKVSRDQPDKDCRFIGPVSGSVTHIGGSSEVALENLKKDAARKGANYVAYEAASADGSGLRGSAYFCP